MADSQHDFIARRERLALRAHMPKSSTILAEVELGNFVGLQAAETLWVSATPLGNGEARASALAAVLAWHARTQTSSQRLSATRIAICDATSPGLTARRASYFSLSIDVLDTRVGAASAAVSAPHEPAIAARPEHLAFSDMLRSTGADVVVEHGVVSAEVLGLQVARVVDEDDQPVVRIGVGAQDREMFKMLHGAMATPEQLRGVVQIVREHRRANAPTHPLNLLAPERALRSRVIAAPESLGLRSLELAEPPTPRSNVKDLVPCCAIGIDTAGRPAVVVFVAGVDLDVVPFAADARDRLASDSRLLIVAEQRNIVPLQVRVAEMLTQPAEFVSA